jgi:4-hydroxy-tetrahydrodipicolinate synthase
MFEGVLSAMITPLTEGGDAVNLDALKSYSDFLIDKGVQGLFACGTTGEGPLLTIGERMAIAEKLVEHVEHRVKVVIHTGAITTADTVQLTKHAHRIGADAASMFLPYFYHYDDDALLAHIETVAEAVPNLPLFLYNIPQCVGNNLSIELLMRIIERVDNIVGLKNSGSDLNQLEDFLRNIGETYAVFIGNDGFIVDGLTAGAKGVVSGNASAFPDPFVALYTAFKAGDFERAQELQANIIDIAQTVGAGKYLAYYKTALRSRGIDVGSARLPHRDLQKAEKKRLRDLFKKYDFR